MLRDAGVNLLVYSGFPEGRGAQPDFVPEDAAAFRRVAKNAKWKLTGPKKAFLISGDDRPGAIAQFVQKLADEKINVTACDAVCAGGGRVGAILWVAPRDVGRGESARRELEAGRKRPGLVELIRSVDEAAEPDCGNGPGSYGAWGYQGLITWIESARIVRVGRSSCPVTMT